MISQIIDKLNIFSKNNKERMKNKKISDNNKVNVNL